MATKGLLKMDALDEKVVSELKGLLGDDFVTVYEAFVRSSDQGIQELNQAVNSDDIKNNRDYCPYSERK